MHKHNIHLIKKASDNARSLTKNFSISRKTALEITTRLWAEARHIILSQVSAEEWSTLSAKDKSIICGMVVKALLDKKKLIGFLAGDRKHLI